MDEDEATSSSLTAYYDMLRDNRAFTIVWLGEVCCEAVCNLALHDDVRENGAHCNLVLSYGRCLQIIDNIGNWLNYVATLSLVEHLAGGQGLLISALIIVRFLPSFLMFPLAGVVADR